MMEEKPENKRFLQTIHEKMLDVKSNYEIDNENEIPPEISQNNNENNKFLEKKIYENKNILENLDSSPSNPKINLNLKESIQYPIELKNSNNKEL